MGHAAERLVGTNAERLAYTTAGLTAGAQWVESDTGDVYWWNGTAWVAVGAGGAAPVDAQYVVLVANATLTQERVLTGTPNRIVVTDGGAGAAVTLSPGALIVQTDQANTWTVGGQKIIIANPAVKGLVINLAAAQSANAFEVRDSTDAKLLCGADERGIIFSDGGVDISSVFFGDEAGRVAATGTLNIGIGRRALSSLTSGTHNVAIGYLTLSVLTSGHYNTAIGPQALLRLTTAQRNMAIGHRCLEAVTSGGDNMAIGTLALFQITTGLGNVAIGTNAGSLMTGAARGNVLIGYQAGYNAAGAYNYITALGYNAGYNAGGDGSVFIGKQAGYNETNANRLYITNSNTATPLIYGEFDNALLKFHGVNADTNVVHTVLYLVHNTSGTPAANFGTGFTFQGQSSTTVGQDMAKLQALWDVATHASRSAALQILISGAGGDVPAAKFDDDATATYTRMLLWDVDKGALSRVTVGIADSGGAGYKLLRVPN